jgi:adenylate cyclase
MLMFEDISSEKRMKSTMSRYMDPAIAAQMLEGGGSDLLGGANKEATIMFTDVRGFTTITEEYGAQGTVSFLNEYFTLMVECINRQGGMLDKFIGDAIMAFWGAPIDDEDHATNGVLAALGMHEKLQELKKIYKAKNWPDINVGIGLSTGPMTVGDMGSVIRKAYTVMGDAVNLGSRLEGITRQYFVNILVSEETMRATKGILFRDIDMVRVKGKDNPITIYEPIAEIAKTNAEVQQKITTWNEMIKSYRLQNWSDAESKLHGLLAADANNKLYQLYGDRIQFFKTNPPPTDWDGVTKFETK